MLPNGHAVFGERSPDVHSPLITLLSASAHSEHSKQGGGAVNEHGGITFGTQQRCGSHPAGQVDSGGRGMGSFRQDQRNPAHRLLEVTSVVRDVSATLAQRADACQQQLINFMFVVPKARAPPPVARCARPDESQVRVARKEDITEELTSEFAIG